MTVSAQKRTEIEHRRRQVAQLYLRKVTQEEIAQKLGISQPTVSRDIYYLSQRWQQEALGDMDGRRGRELAELEEMERDCAMQFANAKDARWLSQRLRVKERIAKMLGLDAPRLVDLTTQGEKLAPEFIIVREFLAEGAEDDGAG